jgi:hypothetical protein
MGILSLVLVSCCDDGRDVFESERLTEKEVVVRRDLQSLETASLEYRSKLGVWPKNQSVLVASEVLQQIPLDPWTNSPYEQLLDKDGRPCFLSLGSDLKAGGFGHASDVISLACRK